MDNNKKDSLSDAYKPTSDAEKSSALEKMVENASVTKDAKRGAVSSSERPVSSYPFYYK